MSSGTELRTRSPREVGYLPWIFHRVSALILIVLLGIHVAVQVYGYLAPYQWGIYGGLLDLTLGLVLLHGFLGVRATLLEMALSKKVKTGLIWLVGFGALGFFLFRVFVLA